MSNRRNQSLVNKKFVLRKTARRNREFSPRLTLALFSALSLGVSGSVPASACSFHSPETIARAVLAINYPDISHVSGAVWKAQSEGLLDMPDKRRFTTTGKERSSFLAEAYYTGIANLMRLEASLLDCDCQAVPFSVVLVDTMLWSGFGLESAAVFHDKPAGPGRLVLATEAAGLSGIVEGRLTLSAAVETGIVKLFGSQDDRARFLADRWFYERR